jgi:hypothetical protein
MSDPQPFSPPVSSEDVSPEATNPEGKSSEFSNLSRDERSRKREEIARRVAELDQEKQEEETRLEELAAADRDEAFLTALSLLNATDTAAVMESGDDVRRRAVLKNVKELLSAVGLKFSLEELEQKANPPKRKKKPRSS